MIICFCKNAFCLNLFQYPQQGILIESDAGLLVTGKRMWKNEEEIC